MPMPMYNQYFPQGYQQYQPQMNAQPQIQNGGLISVRSEMEARNYPIAPGNSITFKDENSPYVYTKTMGFSQLDRPTFEKFRLVKEEIMPENVQNTTGAAQSHRAEDLSMYALKSDLEALRGELEGIKKKITAQTVEVQDE